MVKLESVIELLNKSTEQDVKNIINYRKKFQYNREVKKINLIAQCRQRGIYVAPEQMKITSMKRLLKQNNVKLLEEPQTDRVDFKERYKYEIPQGEIEEIVSKHKQYSKQEKGISIEQYNDSNEPMQE